MNTRQKIAASSDLALDGLTDDMDKHEISRRLLHQASTIRAYQECLDGLKLEIPGSMESLRQPDCIRRCVESLLRSPNMETQQRVTVATETARKKIVRLEIEVANLTRTLNARNSSIWILKQEIKRHKDVIGKMRRFVTKVRAKQKSLQIKQNRIYMTLNAYEFPSIRKPRTRKVDNQKATEIKESCES